MNRMVNYFFILFTNLMILYFHNIESQHIILFSLACIVFITNEFLVQKKSSIFLPIGYIILSFFVPLGVIYFPMISYALARYLLMPEHAKSDNTDTSRQNIFPLVLIYIPMIYILVSSGVTHNIFEYFLLLFMVILSFLLEYHARTTEILYYKFIDSSDYTREINIELQKKNQSLIEKQNSEISLATAKERNRIARDIHDNVGHLLTRSLLMTAALRSVNKEDTLKEPIQALEDTLNTAMSTIRQSVHDLHSQSIHFEDALNTLVHEYNFCPVTITFLASENIPNDVCYCFLAIVKEAMTNTAKHSNATALSIRISEHPAIYQLIVEDNGSNANAKETDGIGLSNMKERVLGLHGNINIRTTDGFRVFVSIPRTR